MYVSDLDGSVESLSTSTHKEYQSAMRPPISVGVGFAGLGAAPRGLGLHPDAARGHLA